MIGNKKVAKWFQILLGLFLIVYSLNKFLHVIPMSFGEMPEEARLFIDAIAAYLPYMYMFEFVIGLFLVLNKWSSFILIVLFPLSASFLMFSIINRDFSEMLPAIFVFTINVVLLINNRKKYMPLFD